MSVLVPNGSPVGAVPWRTYRARIAYIHDGTAGESGREPAPFERGREWVSVSVSPDGSRTLSARCEMDDSQVERHVVYAVDARWRPLDASIRLSVRGAFTGSGWFRFAEDMAECETLMVDGGRVSQRIGRRPGEQGARAKSFGAHTGDDLILVKIRRDLLRTTYVLAELRGDPQVGRRTPS